MTLTTLGDAALAFQTRHNNVAIRSRLGSLAQELSSGQKSDLTKALAGDTTQLRDLDRKLSLSKAHKLAATETGHRLETMQLHLGRVDGERRGLIDILTSVSAQSTPEQQVSAAAAGRNTFETIGNALNADFGGQTLFAGRASDGPALADGQDMLAALRITIAGATSAGNAIAAIDTWFDAPGGGFETLGYLGDAAGKITRPIDDRTVITIDARADDPSLRNLLKAAAIAALADDPGMAIANHERSAMLSEANIRLFSNAHPLTNLRARIGQSETHIETAITRASARSSALTIMRNGLVTADPFETAGALQEVQTQLETHYTVTARLSRLNLAEYLR